MAHEHLTDATKHVIDGASIATAVGTMMQVLPAIAALFTIVWTCIRIYETKTMQKLLSKLKD
jgi:presenilin-like A22 family membrane protease